MSDLVQDVNFFRADEATLADPYPYYEALRAKCPVQREPHHDVVMITGYEEAVAIYNDTERWSSCTAVTGPFPGFPVPLTDYADADISALIAEHRDSLPMSDQLPTMDPPVHADHRALLMRMLTPKRLKENEDQMLGWAEHQIGTFIQDGHCEFISQFAGPFTMLIISDLLGVPIKDLQDFSDALRASHAEESSIGSTEEGKGLAHSPLEHLYQRFAGYISERRENPLPDVLTGMAQASFPDGSTPDVLDVVRVASNLFAAGQETTVRLLSASLMILGEDQDLQDRLRREPSLVANFIEEMLRFESPIKGDFRLSRVPVNVGGVELPAGTTVMLMNAAANRDPRHFDNPGELQIDRANARTHISFGRGVHTCPGSPLARAEARVALERILARTTSIRISDAHHGPAGARNYYWLPTFILRGVAMLHLDFEPATS